MAQSVNHAVEADIDAVDEHASIGESVGADEQRDKFCDSQAAQPGDAEDLPGADVEIDRCETARADGIAQLHERPSAVCRSWAPALFTSLFSGTFEQRGARRGSLLQFAHESALPDDEHTVGQRRDLVEAVGDADDGPSFGSQRVRQRVEQGDLVVVEGRGDLVEEDELCFCVRQAQQFDDSDAGPFQVPEAFERVEVAAVVRQSLAGELELTFGGEAGSVGLAHKRLSNGEARVDAQALGDDADAGGLRPASRSRRVVLPAPLRPMRQTISPRVMSNPTLSRAAVEPYACAVRTRSEGSRCAQRILVGCRGEEQG